MSTSILKTYTLHADMFCTRWPAEILISIENIDEEGIFLSSTKAS